MKRKNAMTKIYFNKFTPITETGDRIQTDHILLGTFNTPGLAYLVFNFLKTDVYKNQINVNTAKDNEHLINLTIE